MKPIRIHPHFVVKTGIEGQGVFALKDIKKGEVLFELQGLIIDKPTKTSVQIGDHLHVENNIAGFINHNCRANAAVARQLQSFVATKDIESGDEITFNYNENEDHLACPFICGCCGRLIKGKHEKVTETQ